MQKTETGRSRPVPLSRFLALAILWSFLILIFLIYTVRHYTLITGASDGSTYFWDFKIFYGGDRDFLASGSLYHPNPSAVLPFDRPNEENNNSPIGSLIIFPLAQLPLNLAVGIWLIISLLLLGWGVSYIWRVFPPPASWHWRGALIVFIYICFPVLECLQLGSWGILVALLDFAAWYYARKNQDLRAGMCLGLAITIRWQPAVIFLYFLLVARRWRLIAASIGAALASCLLVVAVFGLKALTEFAGMVTTLTGRQDLKDPYDVSLRSFWGRFFDAVSSNGLNLDSLLFGTWALSVMALLGFTLWRCRSLPYDYAFSLCVVAGLLLAPRSWMHYHMVLLLPMALLLNRRQFWPVAYLGVIWLSLYYIFPFGAPLDFRSSPLFFGTVLSLGMFWLYITLYREPKAKAEGASKKFALPFFHQS